MMRSLFLFFIAFFSLVYGEDPPKKILLLTVPKSGTHLLIKALSLITHQRTHWIDLQAKRLNPHLDLRAPITGAHLFPFLDQIRTSPHLQEYKTILLIRDPRDVMLSFAGHLRRALFWTSCPEFDHERFLTLSSEEQLLETLTFPAKYLNPSICFPYVSLWMNEPSIFVCRFEDIVGSRGGGSDEVQKNTLVALARHIGYPLTFEEAEEIAEKLYGGTWTFHVGRTSRWKEGYEKESLSLFMKLYGPYLAEWGY